MAVKSRTWIPWIVLLVLTMLAGGFLIWSKAQTEPVNEGPPSAQRIDKICRDYIRETARQEHPATESTNTYVTPLGMENVLSEGMEYAYSKTIGDALKSSGQYDELVTLVPHCMAFVNGNIIAEDEKIDGKRPPVDDSIFLSEYTTLGDIYRRNPRLLPFDTQVSR